MNFPLPAEIAKEASLQSNEYGWPISAFPEALNKAKLMGFACVGGQFQFRLPTGTFEMYWLSADPSERRDGELWSEFSTRSCEEVLAKFEDLVSKTDFVQEASNRRLDLRALDALVFVAYFESESTFAEISSKRTV